MANEVKQVRWLHLYTYADESAPRRPVQSIRKRDSTSNKMFKAAHLAFRYAVDQTPPPRHS